MHGTVIIPMIDGPMCAIIALCTVARVRSPPFREKKQRINIVTHCYSLNPEICKLFLITHLFSGIQNLKQADKVEQAGRRLEIRA